MHRIDEIESIFQYPAADEPAFTVVQGDRNIRKPGLPGRRKESAADRRAYEFMIPQKIHKQNKAVAAGPVIGAQQDGNSTAGLFRRKTAAVWSISMVTTAMTFRALPLRTRYLSNCAVNSCFM